MNGRSFPGILFLLLFPTLLLTLPLTSSAQYAPLHWDPDGIAIRQGYHVAWTRSGVQDDVGNTIYAWADARSGFYGIYAQKISPAGEKLWGGQGIQVTALNCLQDLPSIVYTGLGEVILVWRDFRADFNHGDLYAQKLNSAGVAQWEADGFLLSATGLDEPEVLKLKEDGSGGALVVWQDRRSGDEGDIYAIRITSDGSIPGIWPADGLAVAAESYGQIDISICSDEAGGAIVAWRDTDYEGNHHDIYAQRVTLDAELAWNGGTKVAICEADEQQRNPEICPDGSGGAFIVWEDSRNDNNRDLYFHHILNDGSLVFPEIDGKVLYADHYYQTEPQIVSDGNGNAFVTWLDKRNDIQHLMSDIYAQKVDGTGTLLWNPQGVEVCCEANDQQYNRMYPDETGGFVVAWADSRNDPSFMPCDIYAQKIDINGNAVWTPDGIEVCTAVWVQTYPLVTVTNSLTIIAWDDARNGSDGVYFQQIDASGNIQLALDGENLITGPDGSAEDAVIVAGEEDQFLIFFQDGREGYLGETAYMQVIDQYGHTLLEENGISICPEPQYVDEKNQNELSACTDGEGGAIVVWEDHRDIMDTNSQIFAQKVTSSGELVWSIEGVQVNSTNCTQIKPLIVTDEAGGGIVAWSEFTPNYDLKVMAGRLDQAGNLLWSVEVANNDYEDEELVQIVPDGSGGAYICYYNMSPIQYDFDLYLNRVDAEGNLPWGSGGVVLCDEDGYQIECELASLGTGGVLAVWSDQRRIDEYDIYAQRIDFDGTALWEANGRVICERINDQQELDIVLDANDLLTIVWEDFRNGNDLDIYLQKVDLDGNLLFPAEGIPVCTAEHYQEYPQICGDGADGHFIVWIDCRNQVGYTYFADLYCLHLDANGNISNQTVPGWGDQWVENGNILCAIPENQLNPRIIADGQGGVMVVWEDERSAWYTYHYDNLYAQRVNDWMVGVQPGGPDDLPSEYALESAYPNPFNASTVIGYQLPGRNRVKLEIYDITGRLVSRLVDGWRTAGRHDVVFDATGLASGIYIYRLQAGDFASSHKLILIK